MTNLKTTLGTIRSQSPCKTGFKKLCQALGTTALETEVTLLQILDSNGADDAMWALRCWNYRDYCLLIADVIDTREILNHSCQTVRDMPDTIRAWHAGTVTSEQLAAARAAARAAASAAASEAAWARTEKLIRSFCEGM